MAYVGNLRQYPLTEVLRLIGDSPRRGRLMVERGGLSAEIYYDNGYIVHVWRNGPALPLAQQWLNAGFITPAQMTAIAGIVGGDPFTLSDMEFAQLALERNIITRDALTDWAMNDAVALLSILLTWRDGDYRFEDNFAPPGQRLRWPVYISSVLGATLERIGQVPAAPPITTVTLDDVLDFADLEPSDPHPVQVSRDQWRVLTRVDGESPLRVIARELALDSMGAAANDPQRFVVELHRSEELATRIGGELLAEGLVLVMSRAVAP
jgi:hypothetical protein